MTIRNNIDLNISFAFFLSMNKYDKYLGHSVYELMMDVDAINCDITGEDDYYSYPSLIKFGKNTLTREGHLNWDSILHSYIVKKVYIDEGYPIFFAKGKTDNGKGLDAFESAYAGYCSDTNWNSWFNNTLNVEAMF